MSAVFGAVTMTAIKATVLVLVGGLLSVAKLGGVALGESAGEPGDVIFVQDDEGHLHLQTSATGARVFVNGIDVELLRARVATLERAFDGVVPAPPPPPEQPTATTPPMQMQTPTTTSTTTTTTTTTTTSTTTSTTTTSTTTTTTTTTTTSTTTTTTTTSTSTTTTSTTSTTTKKQPVYRANYQADSNWLFGTDSKDELRGLAADPNDERYVYVVGKSPGRLDPYATLLGDKEAFVACLDRQERRIKWAKQFSTAKNDDGEMIAVDGATRRVFAAGKPGGDLFPRPNGTAKEEFFLVALDADDGGFLWGYQFPGKAKAIATAPGPDGGNRVYVTGGIKGNAFETLVDDKGLKKDMLLAAIDASSGRALWGRTYGTGDEDEEAKAIAALSDGSTVFVGVEWMTSIKGRVSSVDKKDMSVLAVDTRTGSIAWEQAFGGMEDDKPAALALGPDEDLLYFTGTTKSPLAPNWNSSVLDAEDVFVACLDVTSLGRVQWARQVGAMGNDKPEAIATGRHPGGRTVVAVVGTADNALPEQTNRGGKDGFFLVADADSGVLQYLHQFGTMDMDEPRGVYILQGSSGGGSNGGGDNGGEATNPNRRGQAVVIGQAKDLFRTGNSPMAETSGFVLEYKPTLP
ncbi:hypothetical protein PTSG_04970 [Salpingoeca rosetta]|uniref:Uncharacterized protein n=1 Tax=Salpingoeca rosetta (strain ATCC 50818 / BSB-021) TaxID=946362 RepID=F2U954_SALR5|nr:uncharacterized protein PTSG_04970 [Salpingoeca rosetta]EGD73257.1 hypothetical protein PTSG_04970 [Salpingoeca rosetta]|eukprot:XP_004994288.1 hypothetical protein PTSG_04970 [Salpingoeca rosetta]